ncbi:MAG TPA: ATP-dependent sacrificial sulfur transferase LarE [Nitrososphaeraceae archaeon]|nr:ATP-dependent sacrificial sulfur transferase LarE [Nitrososphaeraceae archaeon]
MHTEKKNLHKIMEWFMKNKKPVIVALSGGVDSAVVALAAKKALDCGAIAVTANYNTLSNDELDSARGVACELNITHKIIGYNELANSVFTRNDTLRCYHCRTELAAHLVEEARKQGARLIVDGTQMDDLLDVRPGIRALKEMGIRSPLVECGIYKTQIRAMALQFGLSVHNRPSNSCLASRIPTGMTITYEKLRRIENAETIVKAVFAVSQVRVRDHGNIARIEVSKEELSKLFDTTKLDILDLQIKKQGFSFVTIDIGGYKSANLSISTSALEMK